MLSPDHHHEGEREVAMRPRHLPGDVILRLPAGSVVADHGKLHRGLGVERRLLWRGRQSADAQEDDLNQKNSAHV